jgi:thymidylate kinase
MFFSVSGADNVGKTTFCNELKNTLFPNAYLLKCPSPKMKRRIIEFSYNLNIERLKTLDRTTVISLWKDYLWLQKEVTEDKTNELMKVINKYSIIIADRFTLDSYLYLRAGMNCFATAIEDDTLNFSYGVNDFAHQNAMIEDFTLLITGKPYPDENPDALDCNQDMQSRVERYTKEDFTNYFQQTGHKVIVLENGNK